jgi:hypothetical protein
VRFYPEVEAILQKLPRRGVRMILREIKTRSGMAFKPYSYSGFEKLIQNLRKQIDGLPSYFTLDACRHGGMTELEEVALTEGQGRALPGHKRRKPIAATPGKLSIGHCRLRESVTHIG